MNKNSITIEVARKIIADEAEKVFGPTEVVTSFRAGRFKAELPGETPFDGIEVSVVLNDDLKGDNVFSYYINFSSRWSSAKQAEDLAELLNGCAAVARKLEAGGVPYEK